MPNYNPNLRRRLRIEGFTYQRVKPISGTHGNLQIYKFVTLAVLMKYRVLKVIENIKRYNIVCEAVTSNTLVKEL